MIDYISTHPDPNAMANIHPRLTNPVSMQINKTILIRVETKIWGEKQITSYFRIERNFLERKIYHHTTKFSFPSIHVYVSTFFELFMFSIRIGLFPILH